MIPSRIPFGSYVLKRLADNYSPVVQGDCIKCKVPIAFATAILELTPTSLAIHYVCGACGHCDMASELPRREDPWLSRQNPAPTPEVDSDAVKPY